MGLDDARLAYIERPDSSTSERQIKMTGKEERASNARLEQWAARASLVGPSHGHAALDAECSPHQK